MKQTVDNRINRIVSEVFGVRTDRIDNDSSPDSIPSWDSMSHIHLILALESEFSVDLSPEDSMARENQTTTRKYSSFGTNSNPQRDESSRGSIREKTQTNIAVS